VGYCGVAVRPRRCRRFCAFQYPGTDPSDISLLSLGKDLAEDLDVMLRTATNIASRQKTVTNDKRSKLVEALLVEMASVKGVKAPEAVMKEAKKADLKMGKMARLIKEAKNAGVNLHRPTIMEAAESTLKKLKEQMTSEKEVSAEAKTKKTKKGEEVSSEDDDELEEEEEEEEEGDDDDGGGDE
jgi:hypothetical protein